MSGDKPKEKKIIILQNSEMKPSNFLCILTYLPMLRVTVMMFRDMVESVMLLKEDDWTS